MGSSPIDRTKNPGFSTRVFLCLNCLKSNDYKGFLKLRISTWISLESLKTGCVAHSLHTCCTRPVSGLLKGHDVSLFCATALFFMESFPPFRSNSVAHNWAIIVLSIRSRCTHFGESRIQQGKSASFVFRTREGFPLSFALRCGIISSINRNL